MEDSIFIFNPLTVFFLSGVATQLFVLKCDTDNRKKNNNSFSVEDSNRRVLRWQSIFNKICTEMFADYSIKYEAEYFSGHANYLMNPFEIQSAMLLKVSRIILESANTENLGKKTLKNVSKWFKLITALTERRLGSLFDQQTLDSLKNIAQEYKSFSEILEKQHHGSISVEYPHFSPGALFIRSSFVINLHRDYFNLNSFALWEESNALFLSDLLTLPNYLDGTIDNEECCNHNFLPTFPYIHHLPCRYLYETWKLEEQHIAPVPIHLVFDRILACIIGHATTIQSTNVFLSSNHQINTNLEKEYEFIHAFRTNAKKASLLVREAMKLASNCEKQRRFQIKRKQQQDKNFSYTKRSPPFHQGWSCPFLFPARYFWVLDNNNDFKSLEFAC